MPCPALGLYRRVCGPNPLQTSGNSSGWSLKYVHFFGLATNGLFHTTLNSFSIIIRDIAMSVLICCDIRCLGRSCNNIHTVVAPLTHHRQNDSVFALRMTAQVSTVLECFSAIHTRVRTQVCVATPTVNRQMSFLAEVLAACFALERLDSSVNALVRFHLTTFAEKAAAETTTWQAAVWRALVTSEPARFGLRKIWRVDESDMVAEIAGSEKPFITGRALVTCSGRVDAERVRMKGTLVTCKSNWVFPT